MLKQKMCLLSLSISVSCLVFLLVIVFCLFYYGRKKQKIIVEIDLLIRNYESPAQSDFDAFLNSKKKTKKQKKTHTHKKKYEWCKLDLMTYIDDLKHDNFVCHMDIISM